MQEERLWQWLWSEFDIHGKLNQATSSFFKHPKDENQDENRKIEAFSDVPHLKKCIRNNLFSRKTFRVNMGLENYKNNTE